MHNGFTILITGLPGAGKSTLATLIYDRITVRYEKTATLLDGDEVREMFSSELGYSREHRELNLKRVGYVAGEITRHGGIALCALIAPYSESRGLVRQRIEQYGAFIEVYVATPIAVCEQRDVKGNYAKARAGQLANFTGVSDPYETPENPELTLDMTDITAEQAAEIVIQHLMSKGNLPTHTPE